MHHCILLHSMSCCGLCSHSIRITYLLLSLELDFDHSFVDVVFAWRGQERNDTFGIGRQHDAMLEQRVLLDGSVDISTRHTVTHLSVSSVGDPFWAEGWLTLKVAGTNSHVAFGSKAGTLTPLGMKQSPDALAMVSNGRWIPSKMFPRIPGPNSTDNGYSLLPQRGS